MCDDHGVKSYASALCADLGSNPSRTYQNLFNHHLSANHREYICHEKLYLTAQKFHHIRKLIHCVDMHIFKST